ncbi:MAG: PTS sugar transporter subunit IIA [Candidatus Binatia bacterium]|nr:PTS sugar transporter subunit IIA [Candidatus Binatia bacterium]
MRLAEVLDERAVVVGQSWPDFESTVRALLERLVATAELPADAVEETLASICQRERQSSTAMVDIGVSIPHVRTPAVQRITCALAVAPRAVYEVAFGLPISIVALVLSAHSLATEHLQFLSSLSLLLQSERCRAELKRSSSPAEVLAVVRSHDGHGGKLL